MPAPRARKPTYIEHRGMVSLFSLVVAVGELPNGVLRCSRHTCHAYLDAMRSEPSDPNDPTERALRCASFDTDLPLGTWRLEVIGCGGGER